MPTYLSDEWLREAAAAIDADPGLQTHRTDPPLVLQQVVTGHRLGDATGRPDGDARSATVTWHVVFGPDGVAWLPGPAADPDVVLTCDADTAWDVQRGVLSAQGAFMHGRLRLGGDTRALLAHQPLLTALDDVLAELRARTTR